MKAYIITGTSRGLGEAVAEQLLQPNHLIHCISRSNNHRLMEQAKEQGVTLHYHSFDLSDIEGIDGLMETIFSTIDDRITELVLINNAGVIEPIKPVGQCDASVIKRNITVNTIAPMVLGNAFIQLSKGIDIKKTILNVSSGAGDRPISGWASYCSSKAAIDMFTETVALEQQSESQPVRSLAFSPGIIDTKMQEEIRSSSKEDFASVETFRAYKETGALRDASVVATQLIKLLNSDKMSGKYHITELLKSKK